MLMFASLCKRQITTAVFLNLSNFKISGLQVSDFPSQPRGFWELKSTYFKVALLQNL